MSEGGEEEARATETGGSSPKSETLGELLPLGRQHATDLERRLLSQAILCSHNSPLLYLPSGGFALELRRVCSVTSRLLERSQSEKGS